MAITRTIKSIMEFSPQEVAALLEDIKAQISLNSEDEHNLKLILEEAVTNAIVHGNDCNTAMVVKASVEIAGDTLSISITDEGEGFDFENITHPINEEKEEFKSSGRGIFLIKELAESVSFSDRGRTIIIVMKVKT